MTAKVQSTPTQSMHVKPWVPVHAESSSHGVGVGRSVGLAVGASVGTALGLAVGAVGASVVDVVAVVAVVPVVVDVGVVAVVTVVVSVITPIVLVASGELVHTSHARGHARISSSCCSGVRPKMTATVQSIPTQSMHVNPNAPTQDASSSHGVGVGASLGLVVAVDGAALGAADTGASVQSPHASGHSI